MTEAGQPGKRRFNRGTKYHTICKEIRTQILSLHLRPGTRLPSENDYAGRFRVNPLTVKRALNELAHEGLIVRRRGSGSYVADRRYVPLIPGRHLRIGILWSTSFDSTQVRHSMHGAISQGILHCWGIDGIAPRCGVPDTKSPSRAMWDAPHRGMTVECLGEAATTSRRFPPMSEVQNGKFDALITVGITENKWLEELATLGLPTVLLDFPADDFTGRADVLYVDPAPGYRAAVTHFVKRGVRKIHFLHGLVGASAPENLTDPNELHAYLKRNFRLDADSPYRFQAYQTGMLENGLRVKKEWIHEVFLSGNPLLKSAERLAALPKSKRPEAVICHGLEQAETCYRAFAARGLKLEAAGSAPGNGSAHVHSIHVDLHSVGVAGATLLTSRLQQPDRPFLRLGMPMTFVPSGGAAAGDHEPQRTLDARTPVPCS